MNSRQLTELSINKGFLVFLALILSACGGGGGEQNLNSEEPSVLSIASTTSIVEGDNGTADMVFSLKLDSASSDDISVDYKTSDLMASSTDDYNATSATLIIPAGDTTASVVVVVNGDQCVEENETFLLSLDNISANAELDNDEATATIINDDSLPILSISDASIAEGDVGQSSQVFDVSFDKASCYDITVDYATSDVTAIESVDYVQTSGTLTIPAGVQHTTITVPVISDFFYETDETLTISLDNISADALLGAGGTDRAFGTVVNDDPPALSISSPAIDEGDDGETIDLVFALSLEAATTNVSVDYTTVDGNATTADNDYTAVSGMLDIPAGNTTAEIRVTVNGDDIEESNESFLLELSNIIGYVQLASSSTAGLIIDDDGVEPDLRRLSVQNAELIEGDAGTSNIEFVVTLDQPALTPVEFSFITSDSATGISAEAGSDYEATFGTLTFQPNESLLTISVPVFGDTKPEDDETFHLQITSTSANSTLPSNVATGTILSDDPLTRVSVADFALAEGDAGSTTFAFAVTLSLALDQTLELSFSTTDVTATAGEDYSAVDSTITIPAGDTTTVIEISIDGDVDTEDDEVFEIVLSTISESAILLDDTAEGTILNDDGDGGWAGEENVTNDFTQQTRPQAGFGSGSERQVIYVEFTTVDSRTSSVPGIWEVSEEVGQVDSSSRSPRLVSDDAGRALAVWTGTTIESSSYIPGNGWQTEALPSVVDVRSDAVRLAGNPASGEAIVLWDEPANVDNDNFSSIWAARFVPGAGWQDMGLVETAEGHAFVGEVAMAANGASMAVFTQPPGATGFADDVVAYRLVGTSWLGPTILNSVNTDSARAPKIDMDAAGNAVVTWFQEEPVTSGIPRTSIYVNRYDAGNDQWSGAKLAENITDRSARDPDVAIDENGNVFVVWLQQSSDFSTEDLMANRFDANNDSWSGPQLLEFDDTAKGLPIISQQIVADDLGNAIAIWVQNDGVLQNLRGARYSAADMQWLPGELLEELDTGDAVGPNLVIDRATGDAMVVWQHNDGSRIDIWSNRYTN